MDLHLPPLGSFLGHSVPGDSTGMDRTAGDRLARDSPLTLPQQPLHVLMVGSLCLFIRSNPIIISWVRRGVISSLHHRGSLARGWALRDLSLLPSHGPSGR